MKNLTRDKNTAWLFAKRLELLLVATLWLVSISPHSVNAQDRFDLLQWAPQNLHAAIWTDDLSVTAIPLATSIAELLDRAERELRDRRSAIDNSADPAREERQLQTFESVARDLRIVDQGLEAPYFDGPAIVYRSADDADLLIARTSATKTEIDDFFAAIERLAEGQYVDAKPTDNPEEASESEASESMNGREPKVFRQLVDEWLVVASTQESLDEVVQRIEAQQPIKSLLEGREFRLIRDNLPRGESGSIRFHFDAETTREVMIGLFHRVDANQHFLPTEFKEMFWEATALSEIGGFGGQWTPSIDEEDGSSISFATLEAFAIQGAPFRGLAAALSAANSDFNLVEAAPDAPPLAFWIQLQLDGVAFDREARKLARQVALPFAVASGKSVDEVLEEFWADEGLTWSPKLSAAFESIALGQGHELDPNEIQPSPQHSLIPDREYRHFGLRFNPDHDFNADLDRLCQGKLLQGLSDELADTLREKSYVERIVNGDQVRWTCTQEYLDIYRDLYATPLIDAGFSGENLKRHVDSFVRAYEQQNERAPSQTEIDDFITQRRQSLVVDYAGIPRRSLSQFDYRPALGWFGINAERRRMDKPADIEQGLVQRVALEQQIEELVERTSMQSKPAFVIAAWSLEPLSLKQLRDSGDAQESAIRDLETAAMLPRLIMTQDRENPLHHAFNNSVIIGGLKPRGWELRAEFGRRETEE
jgi:hypothetical protein